MNKEKENIDKLIVNTIRRVGHERDMQDIETLRSYIAMKGDNIARAKLEEQEVSNNRFKRIIISFGSIAAIIAILFSLNLYNDYRQMDKAFSTYYTPLEYDSNLFSRGNVFASIELPDSLKFNNDTAKILYTPIVSPIPIELNSALEYYIKKDYFTTLKVFNDIHTVDKNYLIYKAICLIETNNISDAITLLNELVADGESTEYYQDANWYLAIANLKNHEKNEALKILQEIEQYNSAYSIKAKKLIHELQ